MVVGTGKGAENEGNRSNDVADDDGNNSLPPSKAQRNKSTTSKVCGDVAVDQQPEVVERQKRPGASLRPDRSDILVNPPGSTWQLDAFEQC